MRVSEPAVLLFVAAHWGVLPLQTSSAAPHLFAGMMPPGMMGPGMFPPGAGGPGGPGGPGGKGGDRGDD